MTRHSSKVVSHSWGSVAEARRLADAQAENDEIMAAERAGNIDTDAMDANAFAQCGWCVVGAGLGIVAVIILGTIMCGGL